MSPTDHPENETFENAVLRLCGADAHARLIRDYGGQRVHVPKTATGPLAELLGPDGVASLFALWGGGCPVVAASRRTLVRGAILKGHSATRIAKDLRCSRRHVMHVRAEMRAEGLTLPVGRVMAGEAGA